jgi:ketosteroid isomerase-like protein
MLIPALIMATALNSRISLPSLPVLGDARKDVISAEKDFDAYTHVHGYTKGFFTWSAPDAIVFHPQALRIHDALGDKLKAVPAETDAPSKLRWAPYRVEVASSNDLAFDLGTWTIEGDKEAGWFFTVWKKQKGGKWLWTLDTGAGSADPDHLPATALAAGPRPPSHGKDAQAKASTATLDASVNQMMSATSAEDTLTGGKYGMLDSNVVVLSGDRPPANTPDDIAAALKTRPTGATWVTDGGEAAASGDFTYTWGHVTAADSTPLGHYVRVWVKRGNDWTILVDLYGAAGT